MAHPTATNWTAEVGADIAILHVIPLLERDLPGQVFVLGGLQAIALHAQALSERRKREISAALPQRALPTNELPIIVHMPPTPDRVDQVPASFSSEPSGVPPFQTSTFQNMHGGVEYLGHVKFSSRLGTPNIAVQEFVGTMDTKGREYYYLRPGAVVVEQLALAASSVALHPAHERHAICAALRTIRYAWHVLHAKSMSPGVQATRQGPHVPRDFARETMADALMSLLFPDYDDDDRARPSGAPPVVPAGHQSLVEWWIEKLRHRRDGDIVHQVVSWEHASPLGNDERPWLTLGDEYSRLRDDLLDVLREVLRAAPAVVV
ncbi:uncharacterized protein RHOBADRAFT_43047 [Rhodotorula graminis WP1]|uniref:Uncharacterized protein n=1 Tax=Rhodotorula graminis (strain WP1) TaxID=578459 RepID=A0A194S537_RHOGW|nr:uncharacterized protein RHOBADRAFT_43047 [Rhodotorula graminis WP1]KPV75625.1 hypothetical protein RHOBADRAFT_43047 [Rhodotorula graminis WP1]